MRFLLLAFFDPKGLLAVNESVSSFTACSKHNIATYNLYPNIYKKRNVNPENFDGIIFHNTITYIPEAITIAAQSLGINLPSYEGMKILFKQDEHVKSHITAAIIGENHFDLVFTCVPESEQEKVYPKHLVRDAQFVRHYTGYLSDHLLNFCRKQDYVRNIDVSYRGSVQPLQCGVLGFEKWYVGQSVDSALCGKSYQLDISSQWEDRIGGHDWLRFLLSSRVTLGAESGSNLFDFNGTVSHLCQQFEKKHKKLRKNPLEFYKRAHAEFLQAYEGNVLYAQVSPRHFEAAMTRTLQVLYQGEYSGIFKPYDHYVPLKRDLSNIAEVEEYILNPKLRDDITTRAYEEIALRDTYNIKSFIRQFDESLDGAPKKIKTSSNKTKPIKNNVIFLTSSSLGPDDDVKNVTKTLKQYFHLVAIGSKFRKSKKKFVSSDQNCAELVINLNASNIKVDSIPLDAFRESYHIFEVLLGAYTQRTYQGAFNSCFHSKRAFKRHKANCRHFLKINMAYQDAVEKLIMHNGAPPSAIVCNDLPTLLPAVILAKQYKTSVIYLGYEAWHMLDSNISPWERDFWKNLENQLMHHAIMENNVENIHHKITSLANEKLHVLPYNLFSTHNFFLETDWLIKIVRRISGYVPSETHGFIKRIYVKLRDRFV